MVPYKVFYTEFYETRVVVWNPDYTPFEENETSKQSIFIEILVSQSLAPKSAPQLVSLLKKRGEEWAKKSMSKTRNLEEPFGKHLSVALIPRATPSGKCIFDKRLAWLIPVHPETSSLVKNPRTKDYGGGWIRLKGPRFTRPSEHRGPFLCHVDAHKKR